MNEADDLTKKTPESSHKAQIERFSEAKRRTVELLGYIRNNLDSYHKDLRAKLKKEYAKVKNCGVFLFYRFYYKENIFKFHSGIHCQNKWLDNLCGLRWADKIVQEYMKRHNQIIEENPHYKAVFITLTVKNRDELMRAYNELDRALKRVSSTIRNARSKRSNSEFGKIKGMVGSIEIKKTKKGKWHPHFHALALLEDYIDKDKLTNEWYKKTDYESYITDIREAKGDIYTFCEVLSYTLKVSTMNCEDRIKSWWLLSGKKMLRSWGVYRGVPEPDLLDETDEDSPYIEIIYKFAYQTGYSVISAKEITEQERERRKEMDRLALIAIEKRKIEESFKDDD